MELKSSQGRIIVQKISEDEGKIAPALHKAPSHEDTAPRILNLGIRWRYKI
jgi:hypothetical protein